MTRRIEISEYGFSKIMRIKKDYIKKKSRDKRMTRKRVTTSYIIDMILKNGL